MRIHPLFSALFSAAFSAAFSAVFSVVGLWGLVACQVPPEPPKGQVPPGCAGDDLDLSKVFAQGNCVVVEATESPGAPQLALELSPSPLDVTPGATAKIDVVLRNVSGAELALDLQIPCEPALAFPITIATGSGDQAIASGDPAVEDARTGTACETTQIVRVGLPPSGRARMPLSLRACEQGAGDPCGLPAGQHPLAVKVPLPRVRPAPGVLRVTAP